MKKAVFIDKDGTLIKNVPYNVDPKFITLNKGAKSALRNLKKSGYMIIMITNQSGIARGYFSQPQLIASFRHINELLSKNENIIDAFYYCPHHPEGVVSEFTKNCFCRKPKPGMLIAAREDFGIDLQNSFVIGDILNDIEAGRRAGTKGILLDNGGETEWLQKKLRTPYAMVDDLIQAANIILKSN